MTFTDTLSQEGTYGQVSEGSRSKAEELIQPLVKLPCKNLLMKLCTYFLSPL